MYFPMYMNARMIKSLTAQVYLDHASVFLRISSNIFASNLYLHSESAFLPSSIGKSKNSL